MKCPQSNEEIKHLSGYVRRQKRLTGKTGDQIRFDVIAFNYPEIAKKEFIEKCYLEKGMSLPDFKEKFGFNYEQTLFLLDYFKIPARNHSQAGTKSVSKREKTCLEKYGQRNPSQLQEVKDKKASTFTKNYGVDNIWKTQFFQDNLDRFYLEKYGIGHLDHQKKRSRLVWEKKTPKERKEWLDKSLLSEQCIRGDKKGYITSKPEQKISDILDSLGITHTRQFLIREPNKRYYYDIYIPAFNLIIEFNGDYWHANPNKYKSNDVVFFKFGEVIAQEIWDKDKKKIDAAKNKGHNVIIIWEAETLKLDSVELKNLIENKIKDFYSQNSQHSQDREQ